MVLFYILVFIFGCCLGSFLNCIVCRLENKKSFTKGSPRRSRLLATLRGRSFCPKCKHTLAWLDLVPIFSFLFLCGKCRYCNQKIAKQYLIVEIATGILFLIMYSFFGLNINLIYFLIIACLLEIIFIYDLKHYIIPDKLVFSAIGIALIYSIFSGLFFNFLMAGLVASGFFFLLWLVSRGKWMGFGDVKLALFMGLFLGWPNILIALFFAFILGSIIGIVLIALQKKKMKSQVPFGPFLIAGTFVGLFWGQNIINWYLNLIL